ncbi:hypothetical protein DSO57_1033874 [Entomophthora muscae]|uniref:Uncharacterized protein n=1 Tax=Entomophthora muscae TaxID=34485 RepID=A0ACC2ULY1_9FUNG|nr:hypothetical protein DSO57_1033874 [Entomophthora muscae]
MGLPIQALKANVRREIKAKLSTLSNSYVKEQSLNICNRLFDLPVFHQSCNVSVYLSMPSMEVQTTGILYRLLEKGNKCFVPKCSGQTMDMLQILDGEDFASLPLNTWNIPEPDVSKSRKSVFDEPSGLDLIIMPGLGFDVDRNRIGHGKGYYDKFLHQYHAKFGKYPLMVGLALPEQLIDNVPCDELDVKLDYIILPDHVIFY